MIFADEKGMKGHGRALIWIVCVCAVFLASCGRKTEPLTPDSPRPEAVSELRAVVRDKIAFLSWRVPVKNVEGRSMGPEQIAGFVVYRAEIERARKRPRYRQIAEIDIKNPAPAVVRGGSVFWTDSGLRYGHVYVYRVRAVSTRGGVSPFSEEVRVAPLVSLAPPRNPSAVAGDNEVLLKWELVTTRSDGSRYEGFVAYNIYRSMESGRYEDKPINPEPVRGNSYKDTTAQNDKTFYYIIRAVDSPTLPWRESLDSDEVYAKPKDMTPPQRPSGLTVVPGVGRIFLTWNENKEVDIQGYHVYRSMKNGKDYERLTDKPLNRSTFSDESVKPGVTYYYAVTAVDKSGNESAPSNEQKGFAVKLR